MSKSAEPPARPEISYEQAREELVEVVRKLEAGGTTLEESLALWERGEELASTCQQWLDGARKRLAEAQAQTPPHQDESGDRHRLSRRIPRHDG